MGDDAGCSLTKDEEKLVYIHFSPNVSDILMHSIPFQLVLLRLLM
jgi:hypothetical protein